jgi:Ca2+-binding RTX toxin-like protein
VTLNQAITAVNDAPKNVPGATVNVNEGATNVVLSTTGSAMSVSDVDNPTDPIVYSLTVLHGTLTIVEDLPGGVAAADISGNGTGSIVITATMAQINTTLASSNALLYTPSTDYNGADPLAVYVNDDGQTGLDPGGPAIDPIVVGPVTEEDLDFRAINIAAQNDTPVVPDRGPLIVDEQVAEPLLGGVTVSDVDLDALNSGNGDYAGASFTISRNGGANASDVFSLTGGANFTVVGTDLKTVVGGLVFGTITSNSGGEIVIDFTSSATPATSDLVDEVIQAIEYKIDNDNPPASVDLKYVLDDGSPDALQGGGAQAASDFGLVTVQINPIDDAADAVDDVKTTDEATSTVITVLGNDTDPDGPSAPSVMEIEGTPVADGDVINLVSGAKLTYHADGTITYDPNGAFDDLAEFGTNASNQSRTDSFEYEINSGDIATVVVTVKGLYSVPHILEGTAGVDTITGTANNDIFALSGDADSMTGGAGDDAYRIDHAGDTVVELANEGTDKVFTALAVHNLEANVENLTGTVNTGQTLNGNALDNVIVAGTGADTLTGGLGNDRLDGGAGADDMAGGDGDDLYYIDNIGDDIDESLTTGTDRVRSSISYTLGTNVENLVLTGAGNLDGTGNGDANAITGNTGSNRLDGGAGVDILNGGTGNDTYVVDSASDSVIESVGGGTDTVESSVTYHLSNAYEIEKLTLTGVGAINGFGNSLNNVLTGNNAANLLNADGGVDQMIGMGGNDTYVVDNSSDVVTEAALGGTDTVQSSADYTLSSEVEKLILIGTGDLDGTGNGGANTLIGNSGMNRLDGAGGVDTMNGGGGNDTYVVDSAGDSVIETIGGGTDTVESSVTYTLSEKYETENLTLTGSNPINGFGNGLANTLTGNSANNILSGRGGGDDLYGKAGNDTLYGGDGANDFYFDTALNAATNVDKMVDYTVVDDTIMLSDAIFTAAGPAGALAGTAFQTGPVALDLDDRILYDQATGNIYYDADGSAGGSAAVLFAQVSAGTLLTAADFTIFTG